MMTQVIIGDGSHTDCGFIISPLLPSVRAGRWNYRSLAEYFNSKLHMRDIAKALYRKALFFGSNHSVLTGVCKLLYTVI